MRATGLPCAATPAAGRARLLTADGTAADSRSAGYAPGPCRDAPWASRAV